MAEISKKKKIVKKPKKAESKRYIESVGRRKTATARVRITEGARQSVQVNDKKIEEYFPTNQLQTTAIDALTKVKLPHKFTVTAKIKGGGIVAQSEALRHGIARALVSYDEELRKKIKKMGFLKRDPRMKERKKFGLKKARRAPQWSKR